MPKYIIVNGILQLDPTYSQQTAPQATPVMPIVSSPQDIQDASNAQRAATGQEVAVAPNTAISMQTMQDASFASRFQAPNISGNKLLSDLTQLFVKYEVPFGLLTKLLELPKYKLHFIIDDSGSMNEDSDALANQASDYVKNILAPSRVRAADGTLTRWQEAEDRLHVLFDILAYLPVNDIKIRFFNRSKKLKFTHHKLTPEQFAADAHQQIRKAFSKTPDGGTPTMKMLKKAFKNKSALTMHYLFTDGEPKDASVAQISKLVQERANPDINPLTFISCTNKEKEAAWMKEVEGIAPKTAELDDFISEKKEVLDKQGKGFPYSKGFWLLSQLVAAINPDDLDAMDEDMPLTRGTLSDLMGYLVNELQYRQVYWDQNPTARKYMDQFPSFARLDLVAKDIVDKKTGRLLAVPPLAAPAPLIPPYATQPVQPPAPAPMMAYQGIVSPQPFNYPYANFTNPTGTAVPQYQPPMMPGYQAYPVPYYYPYPYQAFPMNPPAAQPAPNPAPVSQVGMFAPTAQAAPAEAPSTAATAEPAMTASTAPKP